jgi:hypothetical protein
MGLLIEEDARGEIAGPLRVDDIGLAFVRLGLAAGAELEGERCRRCQKEGESGARERLRSAAAACAPPGPESR